ncbi:MAG: ATP phosphoribosyltransferase [Acidimicrobiia bacterium]|nr:ATP phosphoribosyltransferase [Acidimicrobiia bacterium]
MTYRLAVPNKGRLQQPTANLLKQGGLAYEKTDRALAVPVRNMDLEVLFVRTDDVCEFVADEVADLGITGTDLLSESGTELEVIAPLGYGRCRLTAAVPKASNVSSVEDLSGARIATSHPVTTQRFFADKSIPIATVPLSGSVEVAPKLDIADAIVDLVSSGSTLLINGLRPIADILESEAVLVGRPGTLDRTNGTIAQIVLMIQSVVAARRKRYILMNAPKSAVPAIEEIIPGFESPTVIPLAHDGMIAVHSVVDADDLWRVLPELKQAGASGILVLPIDQLIA